MVRRRDEITRIGTEAVKIFLRTDEIQCEAVAIAISAESTFRVFSSRITRESGGDCDAAGLQTMISRPDGLRWRSDDESSLLKRAT